MSNTQIGSYQDVNDPNAQSVSFFVASASLPVTDIVAYVSGTSSGNCRAALYSGSGSYAGALLAQSDVETLTTTLGWVDFEFSAPYTVSSGSTYGLAVMGDVNMVMQLVTGVGQRTAGPGYGNFASGFTNPFGTVWFNDPIGSISIYAVSNSNSVPTPTPTAPPNPTPTPTNPPTPTPQPPTPTPSPSPTPSPTPIPQVSLTMGLSGQGTISPVAGTSYYNINTQVAIYATPSNGYVFSYWLFNDGSQSASSSLTLTMSQSRSALAVFNAIPQFTPTPTQAPAPTPTPIPQVALTLGVSGQGLNVVPTHLCPWCMIQNGESDTNGAYSAWWSGMVIYVNP